jgi:large subunit ribosomal protein L9
MTRVKILLTQDVPELGEAGNIYTVTGGFARNYLIPRGLAIPATKGALKQAEQIRQAATRRRAEEKANAEAQAEIISKQKLLFEVKAGENDRLYGSITTSDIAEQLSEAAGFEIDRRKIQLDQPIRALGLFDVSIRLMPEVSTTFTVAVVREGETWADAEKRAAAAKAVAEAKAAAEAEAVAKAEREAAAAEAAAKAKADTDEADTDEADTAEA